MRAQTMTDDWTTDHEHGPYHNHRECELDADDDDDDSVRSITTDTHIILSETLLMKYDHQ